MANEIPASITIESSNDDAHKKFGEILNNENEIELNGKKFPNPWCSIDEYIPQDGYIYGYARNGLDEKFMMELYKTIRKIDSKCNIFSAEESTMHDGFDTFLHIRNQIFSKIWIDTTALAKKHEIDLEKIIEDQDIFEKMSKLIDEEEGKFRNLDPETDPSSLCGSMSIMVNFD